MNREEKIKILEDKIQNLEPELKFELKFTARKAAEHTQAKDQLKLIKDTMKEYRDRVKDLKDEIITEMKKAEKKKVEEVAK